jgi:hypothetical protein
MRCPDELDQSCFVKMGARSKIIDDERYFTKYQQIDAVKRASVRGVVTASILLLHALFILTVPTVSNT